MTNLPVLWADRKWRYDGMTVWRFDMTVGSASVPFQNLSNRQTQRQNAALPAAPLEKVARLGRHWISRLDNGHPSLAGREEQVLRSIGYWEDVEEK